MSRLPFDPEKMKRAKPPGPPASAAPVPGAPSGPEPLRVSQLASMIDTALRTGVASPVRVRGEIGQFTDRTHWYFSLKDAEAVISCVMFAAAARKAGFIPSVGQEVIATGHVEFYKPQGRTTLRVDRLEAVGQGALEAALKALVEEARALGWLADARKRPMPLFPRRVAVITSRTGAALQDVIDTARRRAPGVELCLIDTLVQGAEAAGMVAGAIGWVSANAARLGIDALIVTRGGGSMEDLWAFNDRRVAEQIVSCSIPVACAIGHETDTTLAELVADLRCATPTQAAMRCVPDSAALREQAESLKERLHAALVARMKAAAWASLSAARQLVAVTRGASAQSRSRVDRAGARLEQHRPARVYERRKARVADLERSLAAAMQARVGAVDLDGRVSRASLALANHVASAADRLRTTQRQLELVGPQAVLARGYSVTLGPDGRVLRSARAVTAGQPITTRLADGSVESVVAGRAGTSEPVPPPTPMPPSPPPPTRKRRTPPTDAGPGLFA
ncbi:MAG: exodeoxyribonuclease VII large subunit [Phycisphaerales bacterium]